MQKLLKHSEIILQVVMLDNRYYAYQLDTYDDWTRRLNRQIMRKAYRQNKLIRRREKKCMQRCYELIKDNHITIEKIIDISDIVEESKTQINIDGLEFNE